MNPLNIRVVTLSLGLFSLFSYFVCLAYGLIAPSSLHIQFLELTLPGFKWLTLWGFVVGLVESFLYGVYAGLVYTPIYNFFHRRWGSKRTDSAQA